MRLELQKGVIFFTLKHVLYLEISKLTSESNTSSDFFAPQMVASDEPPSPKVPLLAKFAKPRVPLTNSVS